MSHPNDPAFAVLDGLQDLRDTAGLRRIQSQVDALGTPAEFSNDEPRIGRHRFDTLSNGAKRILQSFKLDDADVAQYMPGARKFTKQYEDTAKLASAHAAMMMLRHVNLQHEATLAGTALPTFTRQVLLTVMRAFPQMWALQLFGVHPMMHPTGYIFFKDFLYNSDGVGSSADPITGGTTRTDADVSSVSDADLIDYYTVAEGDEARELTYRRKKMLVEAAARRVFWAWSDAMGDDARAVYDEDAGAEMQAHAIQEMGRVVDRDLIAAALANVPAANAKEFQVAPDGGSTSDFTYDYDSLSPSEQEAHDQKLYTHGIVEVVEAIRGTNKFSDTGISPNWMLVGTNVSKRIRRLKGFDALNLNDSEDLIQTGTRRDMGVLRDYGIRVIVDPRLNADKALFGRRPESNDDPAIYYCPYIPLQTTRDNYEPKAGTTTQAVRSRYALAKPTSSSGDSVTNEFSQRLAHCYGTLTLT